VFFDAEPLPDDAVDVTLVGHPHGRRGLDAEVTKLARVERVGRVDADREIYGLGAPQRIDSLNRAAGPGVQPFRVLGYRRSVVAHRQRNMNASLQNVHLRGGRRARPAAGSSHG